MFTNEVEVTPNQIYQLQNDTRNRLGRKIMAEGIAICIALALTMILWFGLVVLATITLISFSIYFVEVLAATCLCTALGFWLGNRLAESQTQERYISEYQAKNILTKQKEAEILKLTQTFDSNFPEFKQFKKIITTRFRLNGSYKGENERLSAKMKKLQNKGQLYSVSIEGKNTVIYFEKGGG